MALFEADVGPQLTIIVEVAIAMLFGGLIGLERELANKPAGFRTHMLVAAAAALFVGLSDILVNRFDAATVPDILRVDPIRIVEAVVTGVSFLGAGTIFRHGRDDMVEGLTTAASMLLVAAVGVAVALNQLVIAAGVTLLTLLVLRVMTRIETLARKRS